jgi:xanthine dehydrogenase accessory factor
MQKKLATWQLISKSLLQNIPVMLLYVLESHGSSPGRQGFCMAVNLTGEMEGSIGGGIMEHKFVEMAKELLRQEGALLTIRKQVHDKSSSLQSGMICSGDQTILLYQLKPADIDTVSAIILAESGVPTSEKLVAGTLVLSPSGIAFSTDIIPRNNFTIHSEKDWLYQEVLGYLHKVFIIGGGHCSLALSKIMRMMDFYVQVFDTRADLHTMLQNSDAHEKTILGDYRELENIIPEDQYIVVMTFGYRTDDIVLRCLMNKPFKYLGVLGSQAKINKMFTDYKEEGINQELLNRMHAPIGMPVKSQTPEEIAISIAAEIIQVKNANLLS